MNRVNSDTPFVKTFKTENHFYIYDSNTNHVVEVDGVVYSLINDIHICSHTDITQKWKKYFSRPEIELALREIDTSRNEDKLFSRKRPVMIKPYNGHDIAALIKQDVCEHLILNVTEHCNLRCRYCVYGGKYPHYRAHANRKMTQRVAEKALDLFFAKSREVDAADIGFYGGEPLTNFDLIKHCVAYAEAGDPKKFNYSMTTNGTLLDEETITYLVDKDFRLRISIDGPKHVHDLCRVDRNGRGSWEKVMHNIEGLYTSHPEFFEKNISVMSVIASETFIMPIKAFFENHHYLSKVNVTASYPNYTPNPILDAPLPQIGNGPHSNHSDLVKNCADQLSAGKGLTPFLEGFFLLNLSRMYQRDYFTEFESHIHINGCCFPGHRRLFVSCEGKLFVCERLDNGYPVGCVDKGLNEEKIRTLIESYQALCDTCLNCWAVRFCPKCFASFFLNGVFDTSFREDDCQAFRDDLENMFVLFHTVLEKNPHAFHFLNEVTLS